jgi:hypothetical protein
MLFATDRRGINLLLSPESLANCYNDKDLAITAEVRSTSLITGAGYKVDVMMLAFQSSPNYATTCKHGDLLWEGKYFSTSMHPYETIFLKANRDIRPQTFDMLTTKAAQMGYNSNNVCKRKSWDQGWFS